MRDGSVPLFETPEGARTTIDGKTYDWFCGCGYLGLYANADIMNAVVQATLKYGMRMVNNPKVGVVPPVLDFQRNATKFFGTEGAKHFSTGYLGNSLLAEALSDLYETIFIDAESHYSVTDAVTTLGKPVIRFAHMDAEDLARLLKKHVRADQRPMLMSDGMFPVSGAIAPAPAYFKALEQYDGALMLLDDAHAVGAIGKIGRGTFEYYGMEADWLYSAGTMSKSFGTFGGVIAGSHDLMERIGKRSGAARGAAAPIPGVTAAASKALEIVMERPEIRRDLARNVALARSGLKEMGMAVDADSPSPIIPIDNTNGFDLAKAHEKLFREEGIYTGLVTEYTSAPVGGAIRIAIMATHSPDQIERLLNAMGRL